MWVWGQASRSSAAPAWILLRGSCKQSQMHYHRVIEFTYTGSVFPFQQIAVKTPQNKCLGWLLCLRSMPTSWLMESSMQPSCSSSKTPSGSLLLITKASSTCSVSPARRTLAFNRLVQTFCPFHANETNVTLLTNRKILWHEEDSV